MAEMARKNTPGEKRSRKLWLSKPSCLEHFFHKQWPRKGEGIFTSLLIIFQVERFDGEYFGGGKTYLRFDDLPPKYRLYIEYKFRKI